MKNIFQTLFYCALAFSVLVLVLVVFGDYMDQNIYQKSVSLIQFGISSNWNFSIYNNNCQPRNKGNGISTELCKHHIDKANTIEICSQSQRAHFVNRQCELAKKSHRNLGRLPKLLIDKEHMIAYCDIPKIASSTAKLTLMQSTIKGRDMGPPRGAHDVSSIIERGLYFKTLSIQELKKYTTFMIVRNPYSRLIAAFNDKMERQYDEKDPHRKWLTDIRNYIRRVSGQRAINLTKNSCPNVEFKDFVGFVVNASQSIKNNRYQNDPHWQAYNSKCAPCLVKYDYILRTETLDYDFTKYILPLLNQTTDAMKKYSANRSQPGKDLSSSSRIPSSEYLQKYSELNQTLRNKTLLKYKMDAQFFGYTFDVESLQAKCEIKIDKSTKCC